jgi:hypothetical protein
MGVSMKLFEWCGRGALAVLCFSFALSCGMSMDVLVPWNQAHQWLWFITRLWLFLGVIIVGPIGMTACLSYGTEKE